MVSYMQRGPDISEVLFSIPTDLTQPDLNKAKQWIAIGPRRGGGGGEERVYSHWNMVGMCAAGDFQQGPTTIPHHRPILFFSNFCVIWNPSIYQNLQKFWEDNWICDLWMYQNWWNLTHVSSTSPILAFVQSTPPPPPPPRQLLAKDCVFWKWISKEGIQWCIHCPLGKNTPALVLVAKLWFQVQMATLGHPFTCMMPLKSAHAPFSAAMLPFLQQCTLNVFKPNSSPVKMETSGLIGNSCSLRSMICKGRRTDLSN